MTDAPATENQIQVVNSFQKLISTPFLTDINAIGWKRDLNGDLIKLLRIKIFNSPTFKLSK